MLCCSTGALMPVSLLLSLKSVTDFLMPSSFLKFAQMKLSDVQSTPEMDNV